MSEISNYEAQKKKLQGLCDEHNFTFRFFKDRYPITLVITPINDIATQMDMLGNVEETGYCSQDSSMCWYFENSELKTKVKGTFSIDKVLRTKIENILLKMISFWQQFFFRDLMENGKLRNFGVPASSSLHTMYAAAWQRLHSMPRSCPTWRVSSPCLTRLAERAQHCWPF